MRRSRKPNWIMIALAVGVVVLVLAGLGLLGAYVYLSRRSDAVVSWVDPLTAVKPDALAAEIAVLPLAGESDERVIKAALDAGELETAYATLVYSVLLPDAVRSGQWALLAARYQQRDPGRAIVCYLAELDQASLSPGLSDVARADLSVQAARGLTALERSQTARLALAQAESIARYSLTLLPAQRRAALTQVATAYQALGDRQTADAVRGNLDGASAGPGVKLEPAAPLLPTLRGNVTLPPAVAAAMAARQQAAARMASRWRSSAASGRAALTEALSQALEAEDAARATFYAQAGGLPLPDRLAALHDWAAWLSIKYRVARGAYGTALAPAWQAQTEEIRVELAGVYTDLINGYGEQLDTLATGDALLARVDLLRQGLLWTRLGLFPDGQAEMILSDQLVEASRQLWTRQGGVGLTVVVQAREGQRLYLLSGADKQQ